MDFCVEILGLNVQRGPFEREIFLRWRPSGKDFIGLFLSDHTGWHHLELQLKAATPYEALLHLAQRRLLDQVRSVGSSTMGTSQLRRIIPSGVEIFTPLRQASLIAELADPDGRVLELVYLAEDTMAFEAPILRGIEVTSLQPARVESFYKQLGLVVTAEGLLAASGQLLRIGKGAQPELKRVTVSIEPLGTAKPGRYQGPEETYAWIVSTASESI
jgi:hypothetical protein